MLEKIIENPKFKEFKKTLKENKIVGTFTGLALGSTLGQIFFAAPYLKDLTYIKTGAISGAMATLGGLYIRHKYKNRTTPPL